ncbi:MAG: RsmD family RNA methyltransferase [Bacillus sp. (in: Bacteria)]|nr:RsmD family RNA methyltransferase [Bacillus sp. (in: firmicutes)]
MRVISGEKKGLPLKAVPGKSTRPTTDKVKESIFNIIGPYFEGEQSLTYMVEVVPSLLKRLSRGMDKAVIVDRDKKSD